MHCLAPPVAGAPLARETEFGLELRAWRMLRGNGDQRFGHSSFSPVVLVRREQNEIMNTNDLLLPLLLVLVAPSAALSFLDDLLRISG